ncbi:hypothetical protein KY345_01720 [Candidatus Woesearchaeota archaeon]|nr:hypothetical protein [Candidatus Woesearchaeota archaeon]
MNKKIIQWSIALIVLVSLIYALEIKSGTSEDITLFLKNTSSGAPIENANCTLDVWDPANSKILNDGNMTELGEGFYYYSTNSSWTTLGDYRVMARCAIGANSYYSAMSFEIVGTTIDEWFEIINSTTNQTLNYLQNTVYPAVDDAESKLDEVLTNTSNIWEKITEIHDNVTTNYNEIIKSQTLITNTNFSVMTELESNRLRLVDMNDTLWSIYDNITLTINPKLDQLQTDVDLIKGYTDTLEAGQSDILANLSTVLSEISVIQSKLDVINTTTQQVSGYVDTIEESLDCDGSSDTPICDRLIEINNTVNTINANTDSLESGQTTISGYVDTLESGQADLLTDVDEVKQYLNCTINITNSMCWMLSLIQSYTDTLESGQTTISNYVDTLESGQSDMLDNLSAIIGYVDTLEANQTVSLSELAAIKGYVDTLETGVSDLDSDIQSWGSNATARFDTIDTSLTNIYTDTQQLLTQGVKLDSDTNATIYQILDVVIDANSTANDIESYLQGTVTDYLSDVNETVVQINETVTDIEEVALQINDTVTEILSVVLDINSTLASVQSDTQELLQKWGTYNMTQIWDKLDSMDTKLDNLDASSNNSAILNAIATLEGIVNDTRAEIGFNGTGYTAYSYLVQLDSKLVEINASVINKIEFEANATREQILAAIDSNTTQIISEINDNGNDISAILTKWGSVDAQSIIDNVTDVRNRVINLDAWMLAFNDTEAARHAASQSLINDLLTWLGIFNQTEEQRHNLTQSKIDNTLSVTNEVKNLSNDIIAQLGYNGTGHTAHNDTVQLMNLIAVLTTMVGNITNIDYVDLSLGANAIALPKQPVDINISVVMANITGEFERVDYWNEDNQTWLIYNPAAPFGNTLENMTTNNVYWVYVNVTSTRLWIDWN